MSKKSNEELREQRLEGDLETAVHSAAWQGEAGRQGLDAVKPNSEASEDEDTTDGLSAA